MLCRKEVIDNIPRDTINTICRILSLLDSTDTKVLIKYNQLKEYDYKLRAGESKTALEAYNLVDDVILEVYRQELSSSKIMSMYSLRIVMSLMIYGCINIELDGVTKDEFISIRTELRAWYKKLKRCK